MSAAFVVDASTAFAWVLPSQASSSADALLKRIEEGDGAVVPPLWFLEIANGLLVAERRKTIAAAERRLALARLSALGLVVDEADARVAFDRNVGAGRAVWPVGLRGGVPEVRDPPQPASRHVRPRPAIGSGIPRFDD